MSAVSAHKSHFIVRSGIVRPAIGWILCLAWAGCAWGLQSSPPSQPASVHLHASAGPQAEPAKTPGPPIPGKDATSSATPSGIAAQAPRVSLADGKLTVHANNSDLNAILQDVAHAGGMSIDGLGKTSRVFGVYGPASPREVLTELLAGAGYNFVMLGGANGAVPRELVLTAQSSAPLPNPPAATSADDENDDNSAYQEPPGPGAIPHPVPMRSDDPRFRMQQRLQNLQQMQERMEQQDQQQQDNPQ